MCCKLAHLHNADAHRDGVSHYTKHSTDFLKIKEFPMKTKNLPEFKQLNNLNKNVSELIEFNSLLPI